MDKYIGMALPPPPVGSGLDKVLSYVDSVTRHSAQSLVSLSPFIIPLLIAAALKITRWAGPLAALLAVVPVLAALLNAEKVLQEMTLMPLPDDRLKSEKKGTSVYPVESYDEKAKLIMEWEKRKKSKKKNKVVKTKTLTDKQKEEMQRKLEMANHLQGILAQGTELSDGPIEQRKATVLPASYVASSRVSAAGLQPAPAAAAASGGVYRATVIGGDMSATRLQPAPAVAAASGGVYRATVVGGSAAVLQGPTGVDPGATEADMPTEFMARFDQVHRTLYGRPASDGMTLGVSQHEVDRMCQEIGIAPTKGATYDAISEGLARAASALGC